MKTLAFHPLGGQALEVFRGLKTETEMAFHGPLALGQPVPVHTHREPALYVVEEGAAEFQDGVTLELGIGRPLNAVLVPAEHPHGWKALTDGVVISHVFGGEAIRQIIT